MNLYLRLLLLLLRFPWVTQAGVLTESRLTFHVLPTDCDINLHLTNGRYLTFMDLGRIHLMRQSRVLTYIVRNRWMPVLAGVEISYLREVPPFKKFELISRLVSWDDKYFYFEHRFICGGILCAHAYAKGLFLHGGEKINCREAVALTGHKAPAPPLPESFRLWAEQGRAKQQSL